MNFSQYLNTVYGLINRNREINYVISVPVCMHESGTI